MATRDHLFISYAWEDGALAEWLTRKLTGEGYRVWCDRFKLLGGESYPADIDKAIKEETFRVIALLSKNSINKPNPLKERTLALNLARERNQEFLIPINVEGLSPTELGWMVSDMTYVPFTNWFAGYRQLLEKLRKIEAPRPLGKDRSLVVASSYLVPNVLLDESELLSSNCFEVLDIPRTLLVFEGELPRSPAHRDSLRGTWAFYDSPDGILLSFSNPPPGFGLRTKLKKAVALRSSPTIAGVDSGDISVHLLGREIHVDLAKRGLTWEPSIGSCYFQFKYPSGLKLPVQRPGKRSSSISVSGKRTYQRKPYRYHLVPDIRLRRDFTPDVLIAQLRIRVYLTNLQGRALETRLAVPRRKALTHSWFNDEWMAKQLAILQFLGNEGSVYGIRCQDGDIRISTLAISAACPKRIDDSVVEQLGALVDELEEVEPLLTDDTTPD